MAESDGSILGCRDFHAYLDTMPGPGAAATLRVAGECEVPNTRFRVELRAAGGEDGTRQLHCAVVSSADYGNDVLTWVPAAYEEETQTPYSRVEIVECNLTIEVEPISEEAT
jgi:hypothetical protein